MQADVESQVTIAGQSAQPDTGMAGPHFGCGAHGLHPAADSLAATASSLLRVLTSDRPQTPAQRAWRHAKSVAFPISVLLGGLFGFERYLASQHESRKARVEELLLSATEALGNSDRVVQASAVRSLARISEFSTYSVPTGIGLVGRHIRASFGFAPEYPYFDQAWTIFRDFAATRRTPAHALVSTEILREGAAWELRSRLAHRVPPNQTRGSLLFGAELANAIANDLDLRGIRFGNADLSGADLSGSDCTGCRLLGARLNAAKLKGTVLDSAYLGEASLDDADLAFTGLRKAVLRQASLRRSKFLQADLTGADLTGAHLDGAVFSQATLELTVFTSASLRGVRFEQSDVSSATFDNADVAGADFTLARGFAVSLLRTARNAHRIQVRRTPEAGK